VGVLGTRQKTRARKQKKKIESAVDVDPPAEETGVLAAMTSKPIILITTLMGIGLFLAAGLAMYRAKPVLSLSLIGSGVLVIGIPLIIVVLFKALFFLLYVFCGLVIIGLIGGGFLLWRKIENKHKANESFVLFMSQIKEVVDLETWQKLKVIADDVKCEIATKEVNKIRQKMKL